MKGPTSLGSCASRGPAPANSKALTQPPPPRRERGRTAHPPHAHRRPLLRHLLRTRAHSLAVAGVSSADGGPSRYFRQTGRPSPAHTQAPSALGRQDTLRACRDRLTDSARATRRGSPRHQRPAVRRRPRGVLLRSPGCAARSDGRTHCPASSCRALWIIRAVNPRGRVELIAYAVCATTPGRRPPTRETLVVPRHRTFDLVQVQPGLLSQNFRQRVAMTRHSSSSEAQLVAADPGHWAVVVTLAWGTAH